MSNIVLDANVAIDWFLESNVGNAYSLPAAMLAESGKLRFCVPEHFHIKVARILVIRARTGKDVRGEKWLEAALMALDSSPIDSYAQGINFELLGKLSKAYDLDVPVLGRMRNLQTKLRVRTEPHELQAVVGRFAVDQHQVGLDVAIAVILSVAGQGVVSMAWFKRLNWPVQSIVRMECGP